MATGALVLDTGDCAHGLPLQVEGLSTTHLGLACAGLEFQRSFASNTLRGVARDVAVYAGTASDLVHWLMQST